jgi:uncharacterized protein (TIGR00369 family)
VTESANPGVHDDLGLSPHAEAIGLELVHRDEHSCLIRLPYADHLVGDPDTGVIHGGVITALLDNAAGLSVRRPDEQLVIATLDLRIDYMGPATPGEHLFAEAVCYKRTTNVAFVRASAYHENADAPVATCVATFMLGTPTTRGEPVG